MRCPAAEALPPGKYLVHGFTIFVVEVDEKGKMYQCNPRLKGLPRDKQAGPLDPNGWNTSDVEFYRLEEKAE